VSKYKKNLKKLNSGSLASCWRYLYIFKEWEVGIILYTYTNIDAILKLWLTYCRYNIQIRTFEEKMWSCMYHS